MEEAPPLAAGPGQVVVRIKAAGVNPVDTYVRAGSYGYSPQVPYTPGSDGAGTVESVGAGVKEFSPGDRVYCVRTVSGTYAEQVLCERAHVHPLPDQISFPQGAAIGIPYATAYRALFQKAKAQRGETVLIHGASGGVGIAAVQLARAAGLTVMGTAGSEPGRRLVQEQGAHPVVDHQAPDRYQKILAATGGRGVSVILEMLANQNLGEDLKLLAPFGRIVVIGSRGPVQIDPRETMIRDAAVLGMVLKNASAEEDGEIHRQLVAGLRAGTLRPVVSKALPLHQAPQAHRDVMEAAHLGKIVLLP